MRKPLAVLLALALAGAAGGYGYYSYTSGRVGVVRDSEKQVFVNSVGTVTENRDAAGKVPRYGGEIEPLTTWSIHAESDQKIQTTYVKVGDRVRKGTKLFTYDQTSIEDSIEKNDIELQKKQNDIISQRHEVEQRRSELSEAKTQAEYDERVLDIQEDENGIQSLEFEVKQKELEAERLQVLLGNTDVVSSVEGVVRSINAALAGDTGQSSDTDVYITIMADGDYRVKVKLNEQNLDEVGEGDRMFVISRTDDSQIWEGTVTEKDYTSGPATENTDSMYYDSSSNEMTSSSNYAFYVTLDSSDGLLLGEHVYVEKDVGQFRDPGGMWLGRDYLVFEEDGTYVWVEGARHLLEKRGVETGAYDEALDLYEITDGLTKDDYITLPQSYLQELMPVIRIEYGEESAAEDSTESIAEDSTESAAENSAEIPAVESAEAPAADADAGLLIGNSGDAGLA